MANHPKRAKQAERAVMVTTSHRGVFFGYATDTAGETIQLRAARNCLYWPSENKGFMGLANMGPVKGARVGPAADIELRDITAVAEVTPLRVCTERALHATFVPPKWKGDRWWLVAMIGETQEDGDKIGALTREVIGECV